MSQGGWRDERCEGGFAKGGFAKGGLYGPACWAVGGPLWLGGVIGSA